MRDYENEFFQFISQQMDKPYKNKREARQIAALANQALILERKKATKEVSDIWKSGHKKLKEENDKLQIENNETYHNDIVSADTHFREAIAMGPPEGTTKANWEKGWRYDRQGLLTGARLDRETRVKEITTKWRVGFKALKYDNDEMQKAIDSAFHSARGEIGAMLADMLE